MWVDYSAWYPFILFFSLEPTINYDGEFNSCSHQFFLRRSALQEQFKKSLHEFASLEYLPTLLLNPRNFRKVEQSFETSSAFRSINFLSLVSSATAHCVRVGENGVFVEKNPTFLCLCVFRDLRSLQPFGFISNSTLPTPSFSSVWQQISLLIALTRLELTNWLQAPSLNKVPRLSDIKSYSVVQVTPRLLYLEMFRVAKPVSTSP